MLYFLIIFYFPCKHCVNRLKPSKFFWMQLLISYELPGPFGWAIFAEVKGHQNPVLSVLISARGPVLQEALLAELSVAVCSKAAKFFLGKSSIFPTPSLQRGLVPCWVIWVYNFFWNYDYWKIVFLISTTTRRWSQKLKLLLRGNFSPW